MTALPLERRAFEDPIRIVIADDHTLFRDGLSKLLEAGQGFEIVGEAVNAEMLIVVAKDTRPDVILLDLAMPLRDGIWALRALSKARIPARTLLLTASIEKEQLVEALKLGAYGVVSKDTPAQKLFEAIRCVMTGQYWVGRDSVSDLVAALRSVSSDSDQNDRVNSYGLTRREKQIVTLVIEGYSNPAIAKACSISQETVKHHMSSIFEKLGVSNRIGVALFAVSHQLTESSPN